jgi:hypothetical protein
VHDLREHVGNKKNDRTDARLSSSTASRNVKDLADYVTSRLIILRINCILDLFDKHMIIFTSSYVRIILFRVQITLSSIYPKYNQARSNVIREILYISRCSRRGQTCICPNGTSVYNFLSK